MNILFAFGCNRHTFSTIIVRFMPSNNLAIYLYIMNHKIIKIYTIKDVTMNNLHVNIKVEQPHGDKNLSLLKNLTMISSCS